MTLHPQAESLAAGFISHFWNADHEIEWLGAEMERSVEIAPGTLLLGIVDALGRTNGELFFGEWKSANPRKKATWKQTWRMNPQSLTYGVLMRELYPDCRRFTVRQAFKTATPTFDFAWFRYDDAELDRWKAELIRVADEIRAYRRAGAAPWPTNWEACFRYGPQNVCTFFNAGCSRGEFTQIEGTIERVSHLETERRLYGGECPPERIILDATRVKAWFECRESYRKQYEENRRGDEGEALTIGKDFHGLLAEYYRSRIIEEAIIRSATP